VWFDIFVVFWGKFGVGAKKMDIRYRIKFQNITRGAWKRRDTN
jgi:hypothetical protein